MLRFEHLAYPKTLSDFDSLQVRTLRSHQQRAQVAKNAPAHQLWQAQVHVSTLESNAVSVIHIDLIRRTISPHPSKDTSSKEPPKYLKRSDMLSSTLYLWASTGIPRKYVAHREANTKSWMVAHTRLQLRIVFQGCPVLALPPLVLPSTDKFFHGRTHSSRACARGSEGTQVILL